MDVSYKEQLMDDIIRQGELGFSRDEIISNLKAKGVPDEQVSEMQGFIEKQGVAVTADTGNRSTGAFIITLLVSLFFIIRGIASFSQGREGFGTIFILCGVIGLIAKIAGRASGGR